MLGPKKLEVRIRKLENYKRANKTKQCHEIEPDPSKDRTMHEGDNPLF
jgi:hypothetical protein